MLHVIDEIEPHNPVEYQDQLLSVLKINEVYIYLITLLSFTAKLL